jgi:hypothetical protein
LRCDDGCIAWLNGVEITPRVRVDSATPTYNAAGMAIGNAAEPPLAWETDISIPNPQSILQVGTNVLAIQVLNGTLNSTDLFIDAELKVAPPANGTPGAQNSVFAAVAPPAVRQVDHTPLQPAANVPVTITAKVTDPDGVGSVLLEYQAVNPGAYLRKTDAAFATTWTGAPMHDDGLNGDLLAADSIFTAVLPASVQTHRRLVRYRITASDSTGQSVRVPYADDEQPNFAYFVYNGVPAWAGADQPPGAATTFPASLLATLPAYHLIANDTDVANSQWNSAYDTIRFWGTLVYEGKVYDHILYHNKGSASTYVTGKNKWRFHFNNARDFEARDAWGRKYAQAWDTFAMDACASPWNPVFRGNCGFDEIISTRVYELAGLPAPHMHFLNFRVVDNAAEAPADQYSGDQWGLYMAIEDPDGSFLDERGLPDGNVYHIAGNGGDKTHQGATHPASTSDWDTFRNNSGSGQTETWWRANLDVNAYYTFAAGNRITGNVDLREGWNHYFYHRGSDDRWVPIPWDLDMMYFPKTHWSGTIDQRNCLLIAAINLEYKNRCRELLDLLVGDGAVTGGQFGQLAEEYKNMIRPAGQTVGWDLLDRYMWNHHPRAAGGHAGAFYAPNPANDSRIGGAWTRTYYNADGITMANPADFLAWNRYLVGYSTNTRIGSFAVNDGNQKGYGYKYLEFDSIDGAEPARPTISYIGSAGFPANDLRFQSSAYADPQGAGTFGAMQWRIGEIAAPGVAGYTAGDPYTYEITDVWNSGSLTPFNNQIRVPTSIARPGHTYRARVRFRDNTNRWSRWSPAVQFVAGTPNVSAFTQALVVSEVMYHPAPPTPAEFAAGYGDEDFEFIELRNVGATSLDLTDVRFTKGVDFDFTPGYTLAAGAACLVVKNTAAFTLRYGAGKPIAGSYDSDSLSNDGEQLKLSYGAGTAIRDFTYEIVPSWPVGADGTGYSIVLRLPHTVPDHALPANWRLGHTPGGNPGGADSLGFAPWAAGYGVSDATADTEGDGLTNLFEYAFAAHPTQPSADAFPVTARQTLTVNGVPALYLTIAFRHQPDADDLTYHVQFSADLTTWTEDGVLVSSTPNPDGTTLDLWRTATPITATAKAFARVQVNGP